MDGYFLIVSGVACIVFRKQAVLLQNRIDNKMFGFIRKKFDQNSFRQTESVVVKAQEISGIVIGTILVVVGILKILGVVDTRH